MNINVNIYQQGNNGDINNGNLNLNYENYNLNNDNDIIYNYNNNYYINYVDDGKNPNIEPNYTYSNNVPQYYGEKIQNNEIIDSITLCEEKIDENEIIPCFFSQIANKLINKLSISAKFLSLIDSMNSCQNLKCFNELKELEIIAPKKSVNLIKTVEYEIKNKGNEKFYFRY